jgi:type III pantothenate kinase
MRRSRTSTVRSRRGAAAAAAKPAAAPAPAEARASGRRAAARAARAVRAARATETLIAVDVGNSETTVGRFRGETLDGFWRLTSTRLTGDEVALLLGGVLGGARAGGATAAVICSVVPLLTHSWIEALERTTGATPVEVSAETAGIPIRYHDRGAVGADRLANAIAVRERYGTPAIVVDLGTATTFDCISREGAYLGGIIAPGVGTSSEELFRRAARIPRVELRAPVRAVGRTTEESLRAGVIWGHAGQIDALVRRLALEMKGTPHVIATGGFAALVAPECETINRVDGALTLTGMRIIWQHAN